MREREKERVKEREKKNRERERQTDHKKGNGVKMHKWDLKGGSDNVRVCGKKQ